jgi:hypothetical protein
MLFLNMYTSHVILNFTGDYKGFFFLFLQIFFLICIACGSLLFKSIIT